MDLPASSAPAQPGNPAGLSQANADAMADLAAAMAELDAEFDEPAARHADADADATDLAGGGDIANGRDMNHGDGMAGDGDMADGRDMSHGDGMAGDGDMADVRDMSHGNGMADGDGIAGEADLDGDTGDGAPPARAPRAPVDTGSAQGHAGRWRAYLNDCAVLSDFVEPMQVSGRVTRVAGLVMEAVGLRLAVGAACTVPLPSGGKVEAEVVGFEGERLFLMPQSDVEGIVPGTRVFPVEQTIPRPGSVNHPRRRPSDRARHLPVGPELLGRVLDGAGRPLDNLGPIHTTDSAPINVRPANPLGRAPIVETLDVGVRCINAMLTVGRGQRMGLFAGSGVGKSVLLGMMARYTEADIIVVGLIGERGREVKEFIEQILGEEGLARSVVVAAPADTPPLMRMQGAAYATAIAEHFRDKGQNVLLIMDSLTRYAMAQREIALAIGEPPATKGYPPSVFAKLPVLVERAGNGQLGGGSITAFYTVLTEGDDQQDPIADSARAILDGHIVLNRRLAEAGHYPAIDIEQSISRAMHSITSHEHQNEARHLKQLFSRYERSRDLIAVGAYTPGTDPVLDQAIGLHDKIEHFLQQQITERVDMGQSLGQLTALFD